MFAIQVAKWMAGFFLPLGLSLLISEFFGWTDRLQSDALTQAIWDSFRHRRAGGIIASLVTAAARSRSCCKATTCGRR